MIHVDKYIPGTKTKIEVFVDQILVVECFTGRKDKTLIIKDTHDEGEPLPESEENRITEGDQKGGMSIRPKSNKPKPAAPPPQKPAEDINENIGQETGEVGELPESNKSPGLDALEKPAETIESVNKEAKKEKKGKK